jgi:hypothetical protein
MQAFTTRSRRDVRRSPQQMSVEAGGSGGERDIVQTRRIVPSGRVGYLVRTDNGAKNSSYRMQDVTDNCEVRH